MLTLDFNILFNIVNILILFLLLRKFLINPIMNVINKREELIQSRFAEAATLKKSAEQLKSNYDSKMAAADKESHDLLAKSEKDANMQYEKILADADAKAKDIIFNAQKTAQIEKEKIIDETKAHISTLAIDIANQILKDNVPKSYNQGSYDTFIKQDGGDNDE